MSKLSELLAKAKQQVKAEEQKPIIPLAQQPNQLKYTGVGKNGEAITFNKEQELFIDTVISGKSCILIGAAGCGKTTATNGAISYLLKNKYIPPIADNHKHLPSQTPAIVAISYTRRAVMNLKKAMPSELQDNCITIHKLLEYQPFFYEVFDEQSGEYKKTMRFEPNRNAYNPLPISIRTIIIDESSMVSVDLFHKIFTAIDPSIRNEVQFIFLGDIQQLPPVFGSAILGYKMLKLQTIELTQVYRQALESPIIRLAHRILSGVPIKSSEFAELEVKGELKLHPWKKKINPDSALLTIAAFFKQSYDAGHYNPETDMILIPFNKACGTDELNKHIANHIARKKNLVTYEVIAGYNKHYFSEGEKILYEKEDAEIISIHRNPTYAGKWPQSPSPYLNYWGDLDESAEESIFELSNSTETEEDVDSMLEALANSDVEDRVREASHILTIKLKDSDREVEVKTASEINSLVMAYSLTIHKSQGSEWQKVFLILHQSHNTMIQRELLYTACTRARKELYCIIEPDSFEKGILGQRIKGNTLAEKAEFFKGKMERGEESILDEIMAGDSK
jgi:ATP-dependent exoDNAse (exonuclease V) alpha subunit